MINSDAYSYVDLMDRALDASYLRQTVISNNIANVDTPQYKRKDVEFDSVLRRELRKTGGHTIDEEVRNLDTGSLDAEEYTDHPNFSYRIDKNNVDIDTENVELASEQLRYQALSTAASMDFTRFKTVLK